MKKPHYSQRRYVAQQRRPRCVEFRGSSIFSSPPGRALAALVSKNIGYWTWLTKAPVKTASCSFGRGLASHGNHRPRLTEQCPWSKWQAVTPDQRL